METKTVKIASLLADPANARKHDKKNIDAIKASLKQFGQRKNIVVRDGIIIAGNGTVEAAKTTKKQRKCGLDGCGKPHKAKGYCSRHYRRYLKYGPKFNKRLDDARYPDLNVTQRFMNWVNIEIRDDRDGCWLWTGSCFKGGYGQFKIRKNGNVKNYRAHRWSYLHFNGVECPEVINHLCENKKCVNPDHLEPSTPLKNSMYSRSKYCKRGHLKEYRARRCKICEKIKRKERYWRKA